jgi:predicted O-methyltransferase YrrM
MSESLWNRVDAYIEQQIVDESADLTAAVSNSAANGLPPIQVSVAQGKLLYLLAQLHGARRILEIGTLGGYSTIWLAKALPTDGHLLSLEADSHHAEVARENIAGAGLAGVVEVRVGLALETLPQLTSEGAEPFDLFFIDADKQSNADYFSWTVRLSRPGSLIIVDNVVRGGAVVDWESIDEAVVGTRRLFEAVGGEPRVAATAVQTVGSKGYDGFLLARVLAD